MTFTISFKGLDASEGHLEAFSGIESAAGIARSLVLICHYAATGSVRHRFPFDSDIKLYLEGTETGSFKWKIALVCAGQLALGLSTNAIYDLTKLVWSKAVGHEDVAVSAEVAQLNKSKSGDIDALVEAVEPALKKGHYGIGETATKIEITHTETSRVIIIFDKESKSYLSDSVDADQDAQDVSVSALNANDRTGRAYFYDLRRTIPFKIAKDADPDTMTVISAALDRYVNKTPVPIRLRFRRVEAIDHRLKRVVVYGAKDVSDEE